MSTQVRALRRTAMALAGAGLLLVGLADAVPVSGSAVVTARLGHITIRGTALRPGPRGMLTARVQVTTSGQLSNELDAAIAAGGFPVAVYHQRVAVGELTDLASCDGDSPPPGLVSQWLHYGPMLIPGRSGSASPPADATLTMHPVASMPAGAMLAVTFYFAHSGSVTLRLPVQLGDR